MDQFFAAVEQRDNPELKGKPIAVGHDAERGVGRAGTGVQALARGLMNGNPL